MTLIFLILKLLNFWSEAPYNYIFGRREYAVFAELHISEISAICLGHTPEYAVFVGVSHIGDIGDMFGTYAVYLWEFHISEISAICLGRMKYLWEFHISEISAICLGYIYICICSICGSIRTSTS